ncbi:MAG TPA: Clp protease N-terminal domain-containing protein [Candidatus Angelobacter sp.]|nr:Clp protease N-terminal domain-containing protein [Candidatus Angelobacter sp.]
MNPLNMIRDMRTIGALLGEAERIARRLGDEEPGAEHLLLAAVGLPDGSAGRALQAVGVSAVQLERAVVEVQAAGLERAGFEPGAAARLAEPVAVPPAEGVGVYRSSPTAQELFRAAGDRARAARQRFAGVHVVLAASEVEAGTMRRVLDRLGIDRQRLREVAEAELGDGRP